MTHWHRALLTLASFAALAGSLACVNVFDPIDNPSGDRQLLSAARAAFDKGDVATARDLYAKVGDETGRAEAIFLDLDSCGADIAAFATALSKGAESSARPGILMGIMAEKMFAKRSTACFTSLLAAYKSGRTIVDPSLRGFVSFLAAIGIAGEVLANNSGIEANALLERADLYGTPATCAIASVCAGCPKSDGISASAGVVLGSATSIGANWGTLKGAIDAATTALAELGVASGPSKNLVTAFAAADPTNDGTFRCVLSEIGVGR